jgi:hypothetical protein
MPESDRSTASPQGEAERRQTAGRLLLESTEQVTGHEPDWTETKHLLHLDLVARAERGQLP